MYTCLLRATEGSFHLGHLIAQVRLSRLGRCSRFADSYYRIQDGELQVLADMHRCPSVEFLVDIIVAVSN